MTADSAYILRLPTPSGAGPGATRLAVKDLLDVVGTPTIAGCPELERRGVPATRDAACLTGIRAAEARGEVVITGKTHLHELAFGVTGINPAYGTPVNPLDATRVPGGSSSGSAVAVASGDADVALGSDTGGSIRIPAACCGIAGLKTTWGRISTEGCWPLSTFLDTIGPLARDVAGLVRGMELLEPGFSAALASVESPRTIGRLRTGVPLEPAVEAALEAALAATGLEVIDVEASWWDDLQQRCLEVLLHEAWEADRHLVEVDGSLVQPATLDRLLAGSRIDAAVADRGRARRAAGLAELAPMLTRVDALALPSIPVLPPTLADGPTAPLGACTRPGNLLGLPALSLPIPVPRAHRSPATAHLPASLQLIGRPMGEASLLALGALVESAVA